MTFVRYPSLNKLGNKEVQDIEHGTTHVFPKLDGTNGSVWVQDGNLRFGSRNRVITPENDNAGMATALQHDERLRGFFAKYPRLRVYGEWLVPHTLKGYVEDAWRKFYIFDVYNDETQQFLSYEEYEPLLKDFGLDYIPCFYKVRNGEYSDYIFQAGQIRFLLKDDQKFGEGVVIKNYNWINQYGRQTWAKIILAEFKTEHIKAMGPVEKENRLVEEEIAEFACTEALVEKEYAKIVVDNGGWSSKYIPRLLETCFYCVVTEELWSALKKTNFPSVNFKTLKQFVVDRVKKTKPEVFT